MKNKKKKLTLNRETLRRLSRDDLARAAGAIDGTPPSKTCFMCTVYSCGCTATCQTVCRSCGDSDCCLASVNDICMG